MDVDLLTIAEFLALYEATCCSGLLCDSGNRSVVTRDCEYIEYVNQLTAFCISHRY